MEISLKEKRRRKKISIANKGSKNPFYGKKHSIETKDKIKNKLLGRYGSKSSSWKGGHTDEERPRIYVSTRKYRIESRFVIEALLKRKLKSTEIVHHIDKNPKNNDINNLQIVSRAEHARIHKPRLKI